MANQCTDLCKQKTADQNRVIHQWLTRWPKRCEVCHGAGGKDYPGSFDYKAGVGEPPSWEMCEECLGQGVCPRCGLFPAFPEYEEDEHTPCAGCGWSLGDSDQEPEPYECQCWYAEEMAAEDALSVPAELDWQQHTYEPD